jgi:hypothetical protein
MATLERPRRARAYVAVLAPLLPAATATPITESFITDESIGIERKSQQQQAPSMAEREKRLLRSAAACCKGKIGAAGLLRVLLRSTLIDRPSRRT